MWGRRLKERVRAAAREDEVGDGLDLRSEAVVRRVVGGEAAAGTSLSCELRGRAGPRAPGQLPLLGWCRRCAGNPNQAQGEVGRG